MKKQITMLLVLGMVVALVGASANAATITTVTDFDADPSGPEMPLYDGQVAGFYSLTHGTIGDTFAGWTWYTQDSTTNTISVPFGVGSATVGEQGIRDTGLEIGSSVPTDYFKLRYGLTADAIALRRTFTGVLAGTANVDWTDNTLGGLYAYYSQDGGSNWTALADGVDFTAIAADLDILFVGNDGADSSGIGNQGIQDITVIHQAIPEPATMSLLALGGLGVLARRRRRS